MCRFSIHAPNHGNGTTYYYNPCLGFRSRSCWNTHVSYIPCIHKPILCKPIFLSLFTDLHGESELDHTSHRQLRNWEDVHRFIHWWSTCPLQWPFWNVSCLTRLSVPQAMYILTDYLVPCNTHNLHADRVECTWCVITLFLERSLLWVLNLIPPVLWHL